MGQDLGQAIHNFIVHRNKTEYQMFALGKLVQKESGKKQMADLKRQLEEARTQNEEANESLQRAHKAVSKIAGYAPIALDKRIEQQLRKK